MAGICDRWKDLDVKFAPMSMSGADDESLVRIGAIGISRSALLGLPVEALPVFGSFVVWVPELWFILWVAEWVARKAGPETR